MAVVTSQQVPFGSDSGNRRTQVPTVVSPDPRVLPTRSRSCETGGLIEIMMRWVAPLSQRRSLQSALRLPLTTQVPPAHRSCLPCRVGLLPIVDAINM